MIDTPEKRDISKEEAYEAIRLQMAQALQEVRELLPSLKHGEAKRLFDASLTLPYVEEDFSAESEAMIKGYSAVKRLTEAKVDLYSRELVDAMLEQAQQQFKGEENA